MTSHPVIRESSFDPKVRIYFLLQPTLICLASIILIPIIPIYLAVAWFLVDRWISSLSCTLTTRSLEIKKGLLTRVESTIPLEKITDLQMYQGPVMRALGLKGFRVETAGQSTGAGHLINILGLVDTEGFREAVLNQRERINRSGSEQSSGSDAASPPDELIAIARDIRDSLSRIERNAANAPRVMP